MTFRHASLVVVALVIALPQSPSAQRGTAPIAPERPEQAWPPGFVSVAAQRPALDAVFESDGLRLSIARPIEWTVTRDSAAGEWLALTSRDGLQSLAVQRPRPAPFNLTYPVSSSVLQRISDSFRAFLPQGTFQTLGRGQIEARSDMFWVWTSIRLTSSSAPAGGRGSLLEARLWIFSHTISGTAVSVKCQLLLPRNLPAAEAETRALRASADFGAIMKSIRIEKAPDKTLQLEGKR